MKNKSIACSITLVCLLLWLPLASLKSQDQKKNINLATVLKLAGTDNIKVQALVYQYQIAEAEYSKAKEWYMPTIDLGLNLHQLNGSAMNADGAIFTEVDQSNIWGGAGIYGKWDFGNGMYHAKAAKQHLKSVELQGQAFKNQEILKVVHSFFDLQASQAKYAALGQLINKSESIAKQIEIQVDAGLRYKSELLLAQSNLNHSIIQQKQAKLDWFAVSARLIQDLQMKEAVNLLVSENAFVPIDIINEEDLLKPTTEIFKGRPEYQQGLNKIKVFELKQKSFKEGLLLPELAIGISNGFFGEPFIDLGNTTRFNAGLMWHIPLGTLINGGDKKILEAKINLQELNLQSIQNQINYEIVDAKNRLNLATQQLSISDQNLALSKTALDQSIARQELRTAESFEVFQAQEFYLKAQLDYIDAVKNYNKSQYSFYIASGNSF